MNIHELSPPEFLTNQKLNIFPPWCFTSPQLWSSSRADQNIEIWERYARLSIVSRVCLKCPRIILYACSNHVYIHALVWLCVSGRPEPRIQSPPCSNSIMCTKQFVMNTPLTLSRAFFAPQDLIESLYFQLESTAGASQPQSVPQISERRSR